MPDDAELGERVTEDGGFHDFGDEFGMVAEDIGAFPECRRAGPRFDETSPRELEDECAGVVLGRECCAKREPKTSTRINSSSALRLPDGTATARAWRFSEADRSLLNVGSYAARASPRSARRASAAAVTGSLRGTRTRTCDRPCAPSRSRPTTPARTPLDRRS
jgi:hypothetical protein